MQGECCGGHALGMHWQLTAPLPALQSVLPPKAPCSCGCCCCALPCCPADLPCGHCLGRNGGKLHVLPARLLIVRRLRRLQPLVSLCCLRTLRRSCCARGLVPDPTLAAALTLSKPPSLLPPWNAASPATTHLFIVLQHAHAAPRASSAPPPPSGEAPVVLCPRSACTRAVEQAMPSASSSRMQPAPVPRCAAPPSRAPEATSPTQRATGCASPGECAWVRCAHQLWWQALHGMLELRSVPAEHLGLTLPPSPPTAPCSPSNTYQSATGQKQCIMW